MQKTKWMLASLLSLAVFAATAQPRGGRTMGLPDFGPADQLTSWSVYSCPDALRCEIKITVTVNRGKCTMDVPALIDRHPNQTRQRIVWLLAPDPAGFEFQFVNAGIDMTHGADNVTDEFASRREHRKRIRARTRPMLLYNILIEYKAQGSANFTPCDPFGPAIINRG